MIRHIEEEARGKTGRGQWSYCVLTARIRVLEPELVGENYHETLGSLVDLRISTTGI